MCKAFALFLVESIQRIHEELCEDVGVVIEAVVCDVVMWRLCPLLFHYVEPLDGIAEDSATDRDPIFGNGFAVQELTLPH